MKQIKVYEFTKVRTLTEQLIRLYRTNDMKSNEAQKNLLIGEISDIFRSKDINVSDFIDEIDDVKLTKKRTEFLLNGLKDYVEDFEMPSANQISKIFRKVKKIKVPDMNMIDTKETSYLGWNDISANRKYIVYKNEQDVFEGVYGELAPTKVKGFCKICNHESDVSLFLNRTKHNKNDGTYTKKGDYICHDSVKCNRHLDDMSYLYDFVENIK